MFQLRVNAKQPEDTAPGNFHWAIVEITPGVPGGDDHVNTLIGGGDNDLYGTVKEGAATLNRFLTKPEGPVRHEFDCSCGALLSIEARRSRQSPYSWDSPRELTCGCGRVYGVKLNFAERTAVPRLEAIYRTMTNVSPRT